MISNVSQSSYLQTNDIKRNSGINKVDSNNKVENSRVDEIKRAIEDGSYQLLPMNTLAKFFSESELGI